MVTGRTSTTFGTLYSLIVLVMTSTANRERDEPPDLSAKRARPRIEVRRISRSAARLLRLPSRALGPSTYIKSDRERVRDGAASSRAAAKTAKLMVFKLVNAAAKTQNVAKPLPQRRPARLVAQRAGEHKKAPPGGDDTIPISPVVKAHLFSS